MGLLSHGYDAAGVDAIARWLVFAAISWLIAQFRRWDWFAAPALILAMFASALGLWMGFHPGWMFSGAIFSLIAWDLTDFRQRMWTTVLEDARGVEYRHIARLCILALAGLGIASIILLLTAQFTLEWGMLLALSVVLSLAQFASRARKPSS
jgi:hypothetical protein